MRIMHLIETLEFGGAERVVIDLANEMVNHHEVMVCCAMGLGDLSSSLDYRVRVFCLHKRSGNDFTLPFRLASLLRRERVEVLHTHCWGVFIEGALGGWLARTRTLVHTVHGRYMEYAPGGVSRLKRALRHAIERAVTRHYARVVMVSRSIQQYIMDDIGLDVARLLVIHNGIRVGKPAQQPRIGEEQLVFMTVGRLDEIKNHVMMIRAFHRLSEPRARLMLVGDGPMRARLEALVSELGLNGRVDFTGFRRDVADLLARGHVFLMSSDFEGVSIAVLEAMGAGLPVIGTRVGGMTETVIDGETGLLFPAGDVDAMVTSLRRLVDAPDERERLGANGRRFLENEFSIDVTVARYEQIYRTGTASCG